MPAKRDVLAEIAEIRGRLTSVDDFDSGILKLLTIAMSTQKLKDDEEDELHAYFVVASLAAIETYFRWQIRRLIDSGDGRFLNNIRLDDLPIRLSHDVAVALVGKRLTVGELVAHTVGFSNFEQVAGFMTKLLATDFVRLMERTREPDEEEPALENPALVIADVKRALELRHIICHEGQRTHAIPNSEIKRLSHSCYMFARGCHYAVARFLNPAGPITREDAYKAAAAKEIDLRSSLKALEETFAEGHLHSKMELEAFRAMEEAWDAYVGREAVFFASVQMNGNQREFDAARTRVRLTERRIEELEQWMNRLGISMRKPL